MAQGRRCSTGTGPLPRSLAADGLDPKESFGIEQQRRAKWVSYGRRKTRTLLFDISLTRAPSLSALTKSVGSGMERRASTAGTSSGSTGRADPPNGYCQNSPPRPRADEQLNNNKKGEETVFGAYGHTGRFVAAEVRRRGIAAILSDAIG